MKHIPKLPLPRRARGFTMAELMVAVTVGLLILAGMTSLFVRNSRAQAEIEKANRQIENGRYGIDVITADLRNAGFYGEFDPTPLGEPTALADPCSTDPVAIKAALPLHVQGYDGSTPSCLTDVRAGTDVLVVRHTRSCVAGSADCDDVDGPLFQASLCSTELAMSTIPENWFQLDTDPAKLTRTGRDCTTAAVTRRFLTHIYYVANNDKPNDHIPTLKRAELQLRDGTLQFVDVPLAEGIENLQLEYGIDTNGDGKVDMYSADPTNAVDPTVAAGCSAGSCGPRNWHNVLTVRLNLVARNTQETPGFKDTRQYKLGHKADGTEYVQAAANDAYKRHVFQSLVPMPNPIGRKQP